MTAAQPVKNFPVFHDIGRFIAEVTAVVSVLSQTNRVRPLFKIHFNVILRTTLRYSNRSLPLGSSTKIVYAILVSLQARHVATTSRTDPDTTITS
jgi:hypothetical protein